MSGDKENKSNMVAEPWYSLCDEDVLAVAEELEVSLSKVQVRKVKERAPDYIDWFAAIESAINDVKKQK